MATIIFSTFLFLFLQAIFGSLIFWIGLSVGFLVSAIATIFTWSLNEKKFKTLIRREMNEGMENDV
jgi:O-antigen/teichoic acid export membrane protein